MLTTAFLTDIIPNNSRDEEQVARRSPAKRGPVLVRGEGSAAVCEYILQPKGETPVIRADYPDRVLPLQREVFRDVCATPAKASSP